MNRSSLSRSMCGQCVVSVWSVCGQCVVSVWSVCGQCVGSEWAVCGLCVVSVWWAVTVSIQGRSIGRESVVGMWLKRR